MGELKKRGGASNNLVAVMTNEHERKVLELLRNLAYGEARIVIRNFEIVQIEEKKSITL